MDGDSDRSAKHQKALRRCAICGSSAHTAGCHDTGGDDYVGTGMIPFATEEVVVEDDDKR